MKHALFILLITLLSCADKDPLPPGIEGTWTRLVPVHPPVQYDLHDGILTQTTYAAGVAVATITRVYVGQGDTLLRIGGALGDLERTWRYRLIGDDVMEVVESSPPIGGYLILERVK